MRTDLLQADWRLGPIGFAYDDWAGGFYPPGLRREKRLAYLATQFQAVELDTTFYALPPVSVVRSWAKQAPPPFRFICKAPAEITHRPGSPAGAQALWMQFLGLLEELGPDRVHPFLQFPPGFGSGEADTLQGLVEASGPWRSRLILEVRHPSWNRGPFPAGPSVAWCDMAAYGMAGHLPTESEFTPWPPVDQGEFLYLRLNGRHGQYASDRDEVCDATPRLTWWLNQLPLGLEGRTVIAVAGNSYAGYAPGTLNRLRALLDLPLPQPEQGALF